MSHFVVLVVTKTPDKREVEAALAPYQENNMGDCPREYLEFLDIEEKCHKENEEKTADVVYDPTGMFHFISDRKFWITATEEEMAEYDSLGEEERK